MRTTLAVAVALSLVASFTGVSLLGQVRRTTAYSTFISPTPTRVVTGTFSSGGIFAIAGGVVLHGKAQFLLETATSKQTVAGETVGLAAGNEGAVYLTQGGDKYRLGVHKGLACPLGRFVLRDGEIAFTVPADNSAASLRRLAARGLVRATDGGWIAKEFANTDFEGLMADADFADTVTLPNTLSAQLMTGVNTSVSATARSEVERGSYINSDAQVTYRVFLLAGKGRAEVAGVPLRYYWSYAADRSAIVNRIEVLEQEWPDRPRLTDFASLDAETTQYDVASLFQSAGIFRQVRTQAPADFRAFVTAACSK
jgi:hypothetical protein